MNTESPSAGASRAARFLARIAARQEGASAVEYGLLVALIALVIIAAVTVLGSNLNDTFSSMATQL